MLLLKSVNICFASKGTVSNLLRSDQTTVADVKLFKKSCVVFLVTILEKMLEESPLANKVVQYSSCLCPNKIFQALSNQEMSQNLQTKMKHLLRNLVDLKIVCLDMLFFKDLNVSTYKELAFVCQLIFTLSHGQSSVERGLVLTNQYLQII